MRKKFSTKRLFGNRKKQIQGGSSKKKIKNTGRLFQSGASGRIFLTSLTLTLMGLLFISDVSAPEAIAVFHDKFYFAKQQLLWAILGILAMFIVSNIKVSFWERWSTNIFLLSLALLILVLIPDLSVKVSGARRWLKIGSVGLQPSEFVKLGLVLYYAKLAKNSKKLVSYIVPLGVAAFLIMLQPDLGTTLVVASIGLAQIFISGVAMSSMLPLVAASVLIAVYFIFSSEYRRLRFTSFMDPFSDIQGSSYHIQQVIFALASGGIFGLGLGQSKQKYLFLPEASTDSIFAIIGEEIGFLGSVAIILVYLILLVNMFSVVKNAGNVYTKVLSAGITSWLAVQTLVNLGSISSAIPFTGVPLPFLSYGGSSLLALLIGMGIIISVSKEYEKGK